MADVISKLMVTIGFSNGGLAEQDLTDLVKDKNVTKTSLRAALARISYPPITSTSPLSLHLRTSEISANARMEGDGKFVVLAGSQAVKRTFLALTNTNEALRKTMLNDGRLVEKDHIYLLTKDAKFNSPSGAANFLAGYNINGKIKWTGSDGRALSEIERQLKVK